MLTHLAEQAARLHEHLVREGFQVETIGISETPGWLARVLAAPPGAVVLDLPASQRGWELMELLKANPVTQDIPVIFYSLLPRNALREENGPTEPVGSMLELDYLAKPVAAAALSQILQRYGLAGGECRPGRHGAAGG